MAHSRKPYQALFMAVIAEDRYVSGFRFRGMCHVIDDVRQAAVKNKAYALYEAAVAALDEISWYMRDLELVFVDDVPKLYSKYLFDLLQFAAGVPRERLVTYEDSPKYLKSLYLDWASRPTTRDKIRSYLVRQGYDPKLWS